LNEAIRELLEELNDQESLSFECDAGMRGGPRRAIGKDRIPRTFCSIRSILYMASRFATIVGEGSGASGTPI